MVKRRRYASRPMKPSHQSIEMCTHLRVRKLSRSITRLYDAEMACLGIKTTQFSLLAHLAQVGSVSPSELAKMMAMDASTLTRNLRPLLSRQWAAQGAGSDSRQRVIELTQQGIVALGEARKCWGRAQERMLEILGTDELHALNSMLDRVQKHLRVVP